MGCWTEDVRVVGMDSGSGIYEAFNTLHGFRQAIGASCETTNGLLARAD